MSPPARPSRLPGLDVLRGVAVTLVIFRHLEPWGAGSPILTPIADALHRGGWVGVDLFFVLSGFLVSGLLFGEYQRTGTLRAGRFLARRGFKIYPAFYFFLLVTGLYAAWRGVPVTGEGILVEALFLQSYLAGLWPHTWSLAVEEHFYFAIALLFTLSIRRSSERPFAFLPGLYVVVALATLGLRFYAADDGAFQFRSHLTPTHLRIDSLLLGVALAYYEYFRREKLAIQVERFRPLLLIGGLALLAPPFLFEIEETPWIRTVGFATNALGSACLLLVAVFRPPAKPVGALARAAAFVGFYSYSIYLWHMPVLAWVAKPLGRSLDLAEAGLARMCLGLALAIGIGIALSRIVEQPGLRLRERWVPGGERSAKSGP